MGVQPSAPVHRSAREPRAGFQQHRGTLSLSAPWRELGGWPAPFTDGEAEAGFFGNSIWAQEVGPLLAGFSATTTCIVGTAVSGQRDPLLGEVAVAPGGCGHCPRTARGPTLTVLSSSLPGLMGRAIPPERHSPHHLKEQHHIRGSITQGTPTPGASGQLRRGYSQGRGPRGEIPECRGNADQGTGLGRCAAPVCVSSTRTGRNGELGRFLFENKKGTKCHPSPPLADIT